MPVISIEANGNVLGEVTTAGTVVQVVDAVRKRRADWLRFTTLTARRRGTHYGSADEKTAGEVCLDAGDRTDWVVGDS